MNDEEINAKNEDGEKGTVPLYMNHEQQQQQQQQQQEQQPEQQQQPTYANEPIYNEIDEDPQPPTYANESDRFPRGASLPPIFCDELALRRSGRATPVAPPRSRRGSRLSLDRASNASLDMAGLVERFHDLKESVDKLKIGGKEQAEKKGAAEGEKAKEGVSAVRPNGPRRPPRRRDRFKKKSAAGFSTLPRDFRTRSLGVITEDAFNQAADREEGTKK